jgi:ribosome biogenesis GTPase / thiamine phosphate phosphatase
MSLRDVGWDPYFEAHFAALGDKGYVPARVALRFNEYYTLYTDAGEIRAEIAGRLLHQTRKSERPAVGDWVAARISPDEQQGIIHHLLPRRSKFSRKVAGTGTHEQIIAANVDIVFIMSSLNQDLNLRRLERYLLLASVSGAQPVILLSKADIALTSLEEAQAAVKAIAGEAPVHLVSSVTGRGLDELSHYLSTPRTVAIVGSSGVGKSTLINYLVGGARQTVQTVREGDRGRHTTTHRELVRLPQGGLIIDTPGMLEIALWEDEAVKVDSFGDIEEIGQACRFRDCRHEKEPGCAVREAAEKGTLSGDRYASFRKLQQERADLVVKKEEAARKEARRKSTARRSGRR